MAENCRWESCKEMAEEGRFYCKEHPPFSTSTTPMRHEVRFGGGGKTTNAQPNDSPQGGKEDDRSADSLGSAGDYGGGFGPSGSSGGMDGTGGGPSGGRL